MCVELLKYIDYTFLTNRTISNLNAMGHLLSHNQHTWKTRHVIRSCDKVGHITIIIDFNIMGHIEY